MLICDADQVVTIVALQRELYFIRVLSPTGGVIDVMLSSSDCFVSREYSGFANTILRKLQGVFSTPLFFVPLERCPC